MAFAVIHKCHKIGWVGPPTFGYSPLQIVLEQRVIFYLGRELDLKGNKIVQLHIDATVCIQRAVHRTIRETEIKLMQNSIKQGNVMQTILHL